MHIFYFKQGHSIKTKENKTQPENDKRYYNSLDQQQGPSVSVWNKIVKRAINITSRKLTVYADGKRLLGTQSLTRDGPYDVTGFVLDH